MGKIIISKFNASKFTTSKISTSIDTCGFVTGGVRRFPVKFGPFT